MTTVRRRLRIAALAALSSLAAVLVACGKPSPSVPSGAHATAKKEVARSMPVKGFMLTAIGDRSIGPLLTRRQDGASLVAWISPPEGRGARRIVTLPLTPGGEPWGPERTAAVTGVDSGMLVVRSMRGVAPGFVIAWTVLTETGKALWVVALDDDGTPRQKPVEIARASNDIVWVEVVPTAKGAVCLWAEETHAGPADIGSAALDTDGRVRGAPTHVARGVTGWQAIELPNGVGLSTVQPPTRPASDGPSAALPPGTTRFGTLAFARLDDLGRPTSAPALVVDRPTVSGDVDVVRVGKGLLFAWTDRTTNEAFVAGAMTDDAGRVAKTSKLVVSPGGAKLLSVAGTDEGAAVLWELPVRSARSARKVHLASFGRDLESVGPTLSLESADGRAPDFAAIGSGYALLATMRDCDPGSRACFDAPVVPLLLRTDRSATVIQREPLSFGSDPASFAWNLACGEKGCVALAASGPAPLRVRSAFVEPRTNVVAASGRSMPPAERPGERAPRAVPAEPPQEGAPAIEDLTAFASGEHVVDLAVAPAGKSAVVATLTTTSSEVDALGARRPSARTAMPTLPTYTLATRVVAADGTSSAPAVISTRALSTGGVAIAPAATPEEGSVLAWTAVENGESQVHVTRLDRRGRRANDVQLTTAKGEVSDVTVTWVKNGWIVAWVDGRDGNGEVYATKIDRDLKRLVREERITRAPGDATDLVALAQGDDVRLAWADGRDGQADGRADIYTCLVHAHDAKRAGEETRLLATVAHSRTPQLANTDAGTLVAWIEEAPAGAETPHASGYGAMLAKLDGQGRADGEPIKLPFGGDGAATSVTLGDLGSGLRAVVARTKARSVALDAVDWNAPARAYPLLTLDGPPSLDVQMVVQDGLLYFNDDGPEAADRRVRRARLAWPR